MFVHLNYVIECRSVSKEFVRQNYRSIGYLERLEDARGKGEKEPDDITQQASKLISICLRG